MKQKKKTWLEQTNERLCRAIAVNNRKPGLYAIPLEESTDFGFVGEHARNSYSKAETTLRNAGYQGKFIYFNYPDPKKTYIFQAA